MSEINMDAFTEGITSNLKEPKYSRSQRRKFHKMFKLPTFGKQFESYARGKVKL